MKYIICLFFLITPFILCSSEKIKPLLVNIDDIKIKYNNSINDIEKMRNSYNYVINFTNDKKSPKANIKVIEKFIHMYNGDIYYSDEDYFMIEDAKNKLDYWKRYKNKTAGFYQGVYNGTFGIPLYPLYGLTDYNTNNNGWVFYKTGVLIGGLFFLILLLSILALIITYIIKAYSKSCMDADTVAFIMIIVSILSMILNIFYLT